MAKIKHMSIESFNEEDVDEMFREICSEIVHQTVSDIRRTVLKQSGSDKAIHNRKATIDELLAVIDFYDIKFEFKLSYVSEEFSKPEVEIKLNEGMIKDDIGKKMDKQASDIVNPDLKDLVKKEDLKPDPDPDINENDIPLFD